MAGCAGLLCGGTSRGLLRDPIEDELECLRGAGFLVAMDLGFTTSTSMLSFIGSEKIYLLENIFLKSRNRKYNITTMF